MWLRMASYLCTRPLIGAKSSGGVGARSLRRWRYKPGTCRAGLAESRAGASGGLCACHVPVSAAYRHSRAQRATQVVVAMIGALLLLAGVTFGAVLLLWA